MGAWPLQVVDGLGSGAWVVLAEPLKGLPTHGSHLCWLLHGGTQSEILLQVHFPTTMPPAP